MAALMRFSRFCRSKLSVTPACGLTQDIGHEKHPPRLSPQCLLATNLNDNNTTTVRHFSVCKPLSASHLMERKRGVNIQELQAKEKKKRIRVARELRRVSKSKRFLKTVDEIDSFPLYKKEERIKRRRFENKPRTSLVEKGYAQYIQKGWSHLQAKYDYRDKSIIMNAFEAQEEALTELKTVSEKLYELAVKPDENLIPFRRKGPVYTPPIQDYEPPKGEWSDDNINFRKTIAGEK